MPGSKHIYLGLYNEESAAARAYDRALVRLRGPGAATNFALSNYKEELQAFQMDKSTETLCMTNTASWNYEKHEDTGAEDTMKVVWHIFLSSMTNYYPKYDESLIFLANQGIPTISGAAHQMENLSGA